MFPTDFRHFFHTKMIPETSSIIIHKKKITKNGYFNPKNTHFRHPLELVRGREHGAPKPDRDRLQVVAEHVDVHGGRGDARNLKKLIVNWGGFN
jgi:hypothetical protein